MPITSRANDIFTPTRSCVWYQRDINSYSDLDTDGALLQMDFQPWAGHSLIAGVQYLTMKWTRRAM